MVLICNLLIKTILLLIFLFGVTSKVVVALPQEGIVSMGDAVINTNENITEINQHSDRAIIDWQNFDINAKEKVVFIQPNNSSITLNKIHSHTFTEIQGQLIANGKVILINQNGVLFSKTSQVDVGGLLVTTAEICNNKFMTFFSDDQIRELLEFDQPGSKDAKIINEGKITAYDSLIGLVAPNVINKGLIVAKAGKVYLSSGEIFTLDLYGDNLINFAVSGELQEQLISNSGNIIADGNKILLTSVLGKQLISSLIINSGALQARSVVKTKGEVIIGAESKSQVIINGLIDVSGLKDGCSGGRVEILGDEIKLLNNSIINASGYTGKYRTTFGLDRSVPRIGSAGGEVWIGSNYFGNFNIRNTKELIVEFGARIYNDSYEVGDAGRTILLSDQLTSFSGSIYSRSLGGKLKNNHGDGGFVEISANNKLLLNADCFIDLTASNGLIGTLLLDPSIVTINDNFISTNNVANIIVIADHIIFDLEGNNFNIGDDFDFFITANDLISVASGGIISTNKTISGGNIKIVNNSSNDVDISPISIKANNGGSVQIESRASVVLGNITADSLLVKAIGLFSNIVIPSSKKIIISGQDHPLNLVASGNFINLNLVERDVFDLQERAYWRIYSANSEGNQGTTSDHIGESIEKYNVNLDFNDINCFPNINSNLLMYRDPISFNNHLLTIMPNVEPIYLFYGDPVPDLSNIPFLLQGYIEPDHFDKDLVSGVPVFRTDYCQGSKVGNYNIVVTTGTLRSELGYNINGNYLLDSIIVNKKILVPILTKSVTKIYDGNTDAMIGHNHYVLDGIINNDKVFLEKI